jgi:hypothetical protein
MYKAYTISSKKIFPGEFMTWAQEGLDMAETYVYPGKYSFKFLALPFVDVITKYLDEQY